MCRALEFDLAPVKKECAMQYRNPRELDLVQLIGKQIESLEKETFVGLTAAERREYEVRQHRIDQLCEELRTCTCRIAHSGRTNLA